MALLRHRLAGLRCRPIAFAGFAAAGLTAAAFAVAPVSAAAGTTPPVSSAAVRTAGAALSGKTVRLTAPQQLKIDLPTAVDGGYRWIITKRPSRATVRVAAIARKPYPHRAGAVGYPYRTIFLLKAVGAGTTRIELAESGPASHVAKRFTLRIQVVRAEQGSSTQHACTLTSTGKCIQGGEFCPQASYGRSGWDANGDRYVCKGDSTHPHWENP